MVEILVFIIIMLITSSVAGLLAGLLGIGGGLIIVPILFNLFSFMGYNDDIAYKTAIATSLATIIVTGFRSAHAHYKKQSVDMKLLKKWAFFIGFGAFCGAIFTRYLDVKFLLILFAAILFYAAWNLSRKNTRIIAQDFPEHILYKAFTPYLIGLISTWMGIGGGTLSTPLLSLYGRSIRMAVGTAASIGFIIAPFATIGMVIAGANMEGKLPYSLGYVNILAWICLVPAAAFFAPIGANIAHKISPILLKRIFAVFLIISALRMIYKIL